MHKCIAKLFTVMLENNHIRTKLRRFQIVPLDEAGKDPTKGVNKKPQALLSPLLRPLELILVRGILPHVEKKISRSQYAYQKARSAEVLVSDPGRFATGNIRAGTTTYVVGLDVAGAFDRTSLEKLREALLYYGVPGPIYRLVGA